MLDAPTVSDRVRFVVNRLPTVHCCSSAEGLVAQLMSEQALMELDTAEPSRLEITRCH